MNRLLKGKSLLKDFPKAASTVFTEGDLVDFDGSGKITPCDSSSTSVLGIIRESVASGDDDYASTTLKKVECPQEPTTEWELDVKNSLDADADVGKSLDISASGAAYINANGTSHGPVQCVGYISTSKGRFVLHTPNVADGS